MNEYHISGANRVPRDKRDELPRSKTKFIIKKKKNARQDGISYVAAG